MRPVTVKSKQDIGAEWDGIADLRMKQIQSKVDLSYHYILVPCVMELCAQGNFRSVIDVGCGIGFITQELAKRSSRLIGVDLSSRSIQLARQRFVSNNCVSFLNMSIEEYADEMHQGLFTLAVANMTLVTAPSLEQIVGAIARLLAPGGHFVFTITHPWFWPHYWKYASESWFDYKKEIFIEAPFKITLQKDVTLVTTHVHRPLEKYLDALLRYRFVVDRIVEPMPTPEVERMYKEKWKFPRFMGIRCIRG